MEQYYLGIDAGGTFTDFVLLKESATTRQLTLHKVLSTPEAPEQAILTGIHELGLDDVVKSGRLHIIHGSTVATNAVLEGKGAKTAFITNRGFADMLSLARQTRPQLYKLEFPPTIPPVPPEYCLETGGRLTAEGAVLEGLQSADLEHLCAQLAKLQPEAVAINLLFSFLDSRFEEEIEQAIRKHHPKIFISRSSKILPEYKEYERGMTTWLNARLAPLVSRYLNKLQADLAGNSLQIMQSSGETVSAQFASERAVNLLLSGPAAGLAAIAYLGAQIGETHILSFDMGGTSTDVALIDGEIRITNEGRIATIPVAVPMVDMHTIGAGGGSIAFLDAGGMLRVGPRSAGADPGPACYGRGGTEATVTDANLLLGRLPESESLAGTLRLNRESARRVIKVLASAAGLSEAQTALGIIAVVNENMVSALRLISVQRGYDPADFILASFGGAGGLHVCALANAMGIRRALVPMHAGVLSALGMLVAPKGRQYSRTIGKKFGLLTDAYINKEFDQLFGSALEELHSEGMDVHNTHSEPSIDLCYSGQSSSLNIAWTDKKRVSGEFHHQHLERYGFALDAELELVNLRLRLVTEQSKLIIPEPRLGMLSNVVEMTSVYGGDGPVPVYLRQNLTRGSSVQGPAIIKEDTATTYLEHNWSAQLDVMGNLLLSRLS